MFEYGLPELIILSVKDISCQESIAFAESPRGRRVSVKGPPQTPGFSGLLAHWRGACGSLWSSAFAHSASASSRSLSSGSPLVTAACTLPDPPGKAAEHTEPVTSLEPVSWEGYHAQRTLQIGQFFRLTPPQWTRWATSHLHLGSAVCQESGATHFSHKCITRLENSKAG